jgi:serine/threonine protein kinase
MRVRSRIVRFLAVSAWDLLLPDIIDKPLKLVLNFYRCFLTADSREKLELLHEMQYLSESQIDELADALAAEWKPLLPGGRLSDAQRDLLRQLVRCLHTAAQPASADDPGEVLRQSLNSSVLMRGQRQVAPVTLAPDQQAVGRSLVQAALAGRPGNRGPRPLPPDAPTVPGYDLLRVLGDGGFSVVYLARHQGTGELRALKVGPLNDPGRFHREVRLLGTLSGPHIVRYYEHGELPGKFWIAMEYLGEFTLADLIGTRPSKEEALLLAEQVLRGLATLHEAGVIHRDLKPDNAIVDDSFRLRLIDFGLAKPLPHSPAARSLSMTAGLIGTPRYMSPEQVRSEPAACTADMWAFGCILFELLTGRPLFESDNIMVLGHDIMTRPINLDESEIPAEVQGFLGRCLERKPVERWPDADEALIAFAELTSRSNRPINLDESEEPWEHMDVKLGKGGGWGCGLILGSFPQMLISAAVATAHPVAGLLWFAFAALMGVGGLLIFCLRRQDSDNSSQPSDEDDEDDELIEDDYSSGSEKPPADDEEGIILED